MTRWTFPHRLASLLIFMLGILTAPVHAACDSLGAAGAFVEFETVQTLFTNNCTGCHTGTTPDGSMRLDAGFAYAQIVGVDSVTVPGTKRVLSGSSAGSHLFTRINCDTTYERMPQGGPYLSVAEQRQIRDWINQGAYNVKTKYVTTSSTSSPAAGATITISAQLADANNNAIRVSGRTVTWSKTGSGGSFGSPTSVTNTNGIASVSFTVSNTSGITYTFTGNDGTYSGTSGNVTSVPGAASQYLVTSSNYGPTAGNSVTITAQYADSLGNAVTTSGRVVTWSTNNGGSFGTTTSNTNASGIATVTFTTSTTVGTVRVTGTDSGAITGQSPSITTVPGNETKFLVTSSSFTPNAGTSVTITAQLSDANNNAVSESGHTVTWSRTGGGTLGSPTSSTNASGVATVTFTTSTTPSTVHTVTATEGALTGTTASITTQLGPAAKYIVTSSSYGPVAGANVTITAQLADAFDNAVPTSGLTVSWLSSNMGSFGTPSSNTNGSGVATVTFTTHTAVGAVTVTGSDGSRMGTTPMITTIPGAATKYVVTSSNFNPVAGATVSISAQVTDVNNNAVALSGRTVTWSSTGTGFSFGTPTSATNGAGLATVNFTVSASSGMTHAVTANDGTYSGTSANISTVTGSPSQFVVTSSASSPAAGNTITITAQLSDAVGNPVSTSGITVTWSKTGAGGSFAFPTSVTGAGGAATVNFTTTTTSGVAYTFTGTGGSFSGTSGTVTTVPGAPFDYQVTRSSGTPVAGTAVTITAQLRDQFGNFVLTSGRVVTWSKTGTGGSFATPTTTTNASGVATVSFTTHTVSGTVHTVTGTDGGSITGTTASITTQVGPASKYIVTSSGSSPIAGSAVTISAQLTDLNNNNVATAGRVVTWSKTGTGGSFATPTSTTNAGGLATISFTTHTVAGTVHTVTGTDTGSLTGTTAAITTTVGPPAKYLFTLGDTNPIAGDAVSVSVQLADANNNFLTLSGRVVTWSSSAGGSFGSATSTTNASGVATISFTTSTVSATVHTVTATDDGSVASTSGSITTRVGAAAKYLVTSSDFNPIAGTNVTITAQLADTNNNAVPTAGRNVSWSRSGAGGFFTTGNSLTNASGIATITFKVSTVAGTVHVVTATDTSFLSGSAAAITTRVGPAAKYLFAVSASTAVAGDAVTLTAQLTDVNGNAVDEDGRVITWSDATGGGGFVSPTGTVAKGIATVKFNTSPIAGTVHQLAGTDGGSFTGAAVSVTTTQGAATALVVTGENASVLVGTSQTISAQLVDANGNNVSAAGRVISWSKTGAGGFFASLTSATDASGVATIQFTASTIALTAHVITAADTANAIDGTAASINTFAGAADHYVVTTAASQIAAGGTLAVTAQLVDANGNTVATAGQSVTWTSEGGTFQPAVSLTDTAGKAFTTLNVRSKSGPVDVTASDGARTGKSSPVLIVSGAATAFAVSATTVTPVPSGSVRITAQLVDSFGNSVTESGLTVSWAKSTPDGMFATTASQTDATGLASVLFTASAIGNTAHAITASDTRGLSGSITLTTTMPDTGTPVELPVITSALTADGLQGALFSYTITATGTGPIRFSASNLPAGLSLSGDTLSGFLLPGTYVVNLTAANAAGFDSEALVIVVAPESPVSGGAFTATDTDADGTPDIVESLAGTDAFQAGSAPENLGLLLIQNFQAKLVFSAANQDSLRATLITAVPRGFSLSGAKVGVRIGGLAIGPVSLDAKGAAIVGAGALGVKASASRGTATYGVRFANAELKEALAHSGLDSDITAGTSRVIQLPVAVSIISGGVSRVAIGSFQIDYKLSTSRGLFKGSGQAKLRRTK